MTCHAPDAPEPHRLQVCPDCGEAILIPLTLHAHVTERGDGWARVAVVILGPGGGEVAVLVRRTGFKLEGEQRGRWSRFRTYLFNAAWNAAKDGM